MNFLSSGAFWGAIIILFGLSILLRELFGISIPFFKLLFGLLLIFIGIKIIAGGLVSSSLSDGQTVIFSSGNIGYEENKNDYSIIFGNGTIDLTDLKLDTDNTYEVNVIFGDGKLILNPDLPIKVKMDAVFGTVKSDNRSVNGFGSSNLNSPAYKAGEPHIKLKISAVFGQLQIKYEDQNMNDKENVED